MGQEWEGSGIRAITEEHWQELQRGKVYPFATVLNPGRNRSIKRTPQEIRIEVFAWILAAGVLGLMAYATYVAAMDFLGK